jgi:hypothetical protein
VAAAASAENDTTHILFTPGIIHRCDPGPESLVFAAGSASLPEKKHLRGVGAKEQRQYEHIEKAAERSGRYGRRAKEFAARTVMNKERGHQPGE